MALLIPRVSEILKIVWMLSSNFRDPLHKKWSCDGNAHFCYLIPNSIKPYHTHEKGKAGQYNYTITSVLGKLSARFLGQLQLQAATVEGTKRYACSIPVLPLLIRERAVALSLQTFFSFVSGIQTTHSTQFGKNNIYIYLFIVLLSLVYAFPPLSLKNCT